MAQPNVTNYVLAASSSTSLINAAPVTAANTAFTLATATVDAHQRRLLLTATGNESANTFTVVGTNEAGMPITDTITGPNNSTTVSNLDFLTVSSVKASAATGGTTSLGTYAVGASLWNIVNLNATPFNIEASVVIQSGAADYSVQYTYDDPNNLPSGVSAPAAYNHPTMANVTASMDGPINDPVFATRLQVNSGTGTLRFTQIQAGLASP